jgi:signal transduction histidine kinase
MMVPCGLGDIAEKGRSAIIETPAGERHSIESHDNRSVGAKPRRLRYPHRRHDPTPAGTAACTPHRIIMLEEAALPLLKSLKGQLLAFWIIVVTVFVALAVTVIVLFQSSAGVVIDEARVAASRSCSAIADRYARSMADPSSATPQVDLLNVVLRLVLIEVPHVEGGVWSSGGGFLAYSYPTYEGSSDKRDIPQAEQGHIAELSQVAARTRQLEADTVRGTREALIVVACPLRSPNHDLVAWTMTRASTFALGAHASLRIGLGALLAVVLASGLWLGLILKRGLGHVRRMEDALARSSADDAGMPLLAPTGVVELDRIVHGFNRYRDRFMQAQARSREATLQVAHEQRLATLGRMTGGIAHEIRNPIATMRLKAENALAAPVERQADALRVILEQIARLDRLVQSLLAVVQPLQLEPQSVEVRAWLAERAEAASAQAARRGVTLAVESEVMVASLDPLHLGRAVDNLLDNAIRHAPPGGRVTLRAQRSPGNRWAIQVDDDGPGIDEAVAAQMFEPFATGRADGTGLGLALAREAATAHGGELRYLRLQPGSRFELELPWQTS